MMVTFPPETSGSGASSWGGWVLMRQEEVPSRWRSRATVLALVPLLPEEMAGVLDDGTSESRLTTEELAIARLLAAGAPVAQIARDLRLPLRTVQRRVGRLRERYGVETSRDLGAFFAKRGF